MPINTDARIYAGLFEVGDDAQHPLEADRGAWIQAVDGTLRAADIRLEAGDSIGITAADGLDLQFEADSEVPLFDVCMDAPLLWK